MKVLNSVFSKLAATPVRYGARTILLAAASFVALSADGSPASAAETRAYAVKWFHYAN